MSVAIIRSRELKLHQILVHSINWVWLPAGLKCEQISWLKSFVNSVCMIGVQKTPMPMTFIAGLAAGLTGLKGVGV